MAVKKSYTKIRAYGVEASVATASETKILLKGENGAGTIAEVAVVIDDYMIPYVVSELKKIVDKRVSDANDLAYRFKCVATSN